MRAILISNHGLCKSCPTITKIPLKFFRPSPHLEKLPLILPVSPLLNLKFYGTRHPLLMISWYSGKSIVCKLLLRTFGIKITISNAIFLFFCCISSIALLKSVVSNMTSLLGVHIDNICKANTVPRKEETNPEWIVCVFRLRIFFFMFYLYYSLFWPSAALDILH